MQHVENGAPPLSLKMVGFAYQSGVVLRDISATVSATDYALLVGANGAGKSTLLRVALGLLEPAAGEVRLFGLPPRDKRARARLGYVPQRAALSARVPATVFEVVVAGRAGRRVLGAFSREDRNAAAHALERVGMHDLAGRRIGDLSGGQQQRVLIARALATEPALLVLDEPVAGVDRDSQLQFASVLRGLHDTGVAILVVAHDLGAIGGDVTRVLALHQGHIDEIPLDQVRERIGPFVEDHAQ